MNKTSIRTVAKHIYIDIQTDAMFGGWADIPDWKDTADSHREMTVASVVRLLAYPGEMTPELSHHLWQIFAFKAGWRHGKEFNPFGDPPTTPRMVPFECLEPHHKRESDIVVAGFRLHRDALMKKYGVYCPHTADPADGSKAEFSKAHINTQNFYMK